MRLTEIETTKAGRECTVRSVELKVIEVGRDLIEMKVIEIGREHAERLIEIEVIETGRERAEQLIGIAIDMIAKPTETWNVTMSGRARAGCVVRVGSK